MCQCYAISVSVASSSGAAGLGLMKTVRESAPLFPALLKVASRGSKERHLVLHDSLLNRGSNMQLDRKRIDEMKHEQDSSFSVLC